MKKLVCIICGYVHEGDCPPEKVVLSVVLVLKSLKNRLANYLGLLNMKLVLQKVSTLRLLKVLEKTSMVNVQKLVCTWQ